MPCVARSLSIDPPDVPRHHRAEECARSSRRCGSRMSATVAASRSSAVSGLDGDAAHAVLQRSGQHIGRKPSKEAVCRLTAGREAPRVSASMTRTLASLPLNSGAPITYVAAQLGHAKATTTLQWYPHFLPSDDDHRIVDALDRDLERGSDPTLAPNRPNLIEHRDVESEALPPTRKSPRFPGGFSSGPRVTRTLDPLMGCQRRRDETMNITRVERVPDHVAAAAWKAALTTFCAGT